MVTTAPLATPTRQTQDTDITHEVCCTDEQATTGRISMCGLPIDDGELLDEDAPSCAVCLDLIEQWAHNADTHREDPHRPGDAPCRLCPRRHT